MAVRLITRPAPGGGGARTRRLLLPGALALAVGLVVGATAPPSVSADCHCWRYLRLDANEPPATPRQETTLSEVTAPSYQLAWAVGSQGSGPLLARWNGLRWQQTPLPLPADTLLEGITSSSPRDTWTVGYGSDAAPRAAHWDGGAWRPVTVPAQGPAYPRAIDARTSGDAWIVGAGGGGTAQATSWHWDGQSWRQVLIPDGRPTASSLTAVSAHAANDAWAVGTRGSSPARQLLMHWDGQGWTPFVAPDLSGEATLADVVALGRSDVWAVGSATIPSSLGSAGAAPGTLLDRPLAEHWDGRAWRDVPVPRTVGRFYSVTSDGRGGIWAAGEKGDGRGFFARWDGHRWDLSPAPVPAVPGAGPVGSGVWGLAQISGTDSVWGVGAYEITGGRTPAHRAATWTNAARPR